VYCAQKGLMAAVQGAAIGGSELLNLRYDLARVRSALGHKRGLSPQKVTDQMLVDVFTEFDADNSGSISVEEIAATIKSLGVKMSQRELKEMLVDMDYDGSGEISIEEFVRWWKESVQGNAVEVIHTMAEYEQVLEDEDGTGSFVCVMVGVTYCKPCKAFSGKYKDFAERFSNARFLKIFGNENKDMTRLARDMLKVKSTPSFYILRDKEVVHFHSGANAGKFEKAMLDNSREGDEGYGSEPLFAEELQKAVKKDAEKAAAEAKKAAEEKAKGEKAAA